MYQLCYTIGSAFLGLIAFYVRDWRILQFIVGLPLFLCATLYWYNKIEFNNLNIKLSWFFLSSLGFPRDAMTKLVNSYPKQQKLTAKWYQITYLLLRVQMANQMKRNQNKFIISKMYLFIQPINNLFAFEIRRTITTTPIVR